MKYRHCKALLSLFALLLAQAWPPLLQANWQSLSSIYLAAEEFIATYPYDTGYPATLSLSKADSRLRLKVCESPVTISFAEASKHYGRITLEARCEAPTQWKLRLPGKISLPADVLVASHALARKQNLTAADWRWQTVDLGSLRGDIFRDPEQLKGQRLRQNIAEGKVLMAHQLEPRPLVESGQQVTIELQYKGLLIRTNGTALDTGTRGEIISVRNDRSGKVIEAEISAESKVKVRL